MPSKWRLIDSGSCEASFNMALDDAIFRFVRDGESIPTLRFYGWKRTSITIGWFQRMDLINLLYCKERDIPIVRRPTGGKALLHQDELTYSFSALNENPFSRGLFQTYYSLSQALIAAFKLSGIEVELYESKDTSADQLTPLCFRTPSYGELTFKGYKIVGSAQRRTERGFLQQSSIPFFIDSEKLKNIFNLSKDISLKIPTIKDLAPKLTLESLKTNIFVAFERIFNVVLVPSSPTEEELALAERLAYTKYKSLLE
ncbi:MAG: lipoate--protein ligase family protein [Thermodesulfovibrionales bacterium]|nr:lipoate--protein ligase family protein [Thermodesulfovibrionales bacterium]